MHIEGAGFAVGEAVLRVVDLRAGDADVGEDGVHRAGFWLSPASPSTCGSRGEVVVKEVEAGVEAGGSEGFETCAGVRCWMDRSRFR